MLYCTFITGTCISVRGRPLRLPVLPGLHRVSLFNGGQAIDEHTTKSLILKDVV